MTRSTVTPWLANPARARTRKAAALVRQEFGAGEPAGVIDGRVKRLPFGPSLAALATPVAGDAVADPVDAIQLLGVDVDELARMFALVADDGRLRIETGRAAEVEPSRYRTHRRDRSPRLPGYRRPGQALPSQPLNLGHPDAWDSGADAMSDPGDPPPPGREPVPPVADGLRINPHRASHPAAFQPSASRSTMGRRLCGVVRAFS